MVPPHDQQNELKWEILEQDLDTGSQELSAASGYPLYAGPNPDQALECETDNYLGLGVNVAPCTKAEGCHRNDKKNLATGMEKYIHGRQGRTEGFCCGNIATDGWSRMMKTTRHYAIRCGYTLRHGPMTVSMYCSGHRLHVAIGQRSKGLLDVLRRAHVLRYRVRQG